jgi:hypothetical protein
MIDGKIPEIPEIPDDLVVDDSVVPRFDRIEDARYASPQAPSSVQSSSSSMDLVGPGSPAIHSSSSMDLVGSDSSAILSTILTELQSIAAILRDMRS